MPSNKQRIIGAIASIGITVGGAWLASQLSSTGSVTSKRTSLDERGTPAATRSHTAQLTKVVTTKTDLTLIASNNPFDAQVAAAPPIT